MIVPASRRLRRGFTLLETAIVLAITVIGGLLVLPQWNAARTGPAGVSTAANANEAPGASLAGALLEARQRAILHRQVVTVRMNRELALIRIDTTGGNGTGLWAELPLQLEDGVTLETRDPITLVEFQPSGSAISDSLPIRSRAGWSALVVDAWSGEVRLDGAHASRE
ncbi:pilus assembly FimT family protein [Gemmatimonas sp.]